MQLATRTQTGCLAQAAATVDCLACCPGLCCGALRWHHQEAAGRDGGHPPLKRGGVCHADGAQTEVQTGRADRGRPAASLTEIPLGFIALQSPFIPIYDMHMLCQCLQAITVGY